ncbi:MAG: TolC family protein [Deltaproteobacteria bacterium]|nr:TolC family protein [Deltaproteobacteria bacterium]
MEASPAPPQIEGVPRFLAALLVVALPSAVSAQSLRVSDALGAALQANPSVRASLFDVLAAREATRAAEDARVPVFRASVDGSFRESFSGTAEGVTLNDSRALSAGVGLDWTSEVGTTLSIDLTTSSSWRTVNRDPSTTTSFTIGPNYDAQLLATVRQPLLRGAGRDATLANERAARASATATNASRETEVSGVIRDVLSAYWELWYAERALDVQQGAVELAERQLRDADAQVELGSLAPADRLRFASELASLRETRRSAELTVATQRLTLARLVAAEANALSVDPEAPTQPSLGELRSLLARAAAQSPELAALDANVEQAEQNALSARNAARARVDLVGSAGMVTLWADDTLSGLQLPTGRPGFVVTGGLEVELPLGSSTADARRAQAEAQLEAARARREAGDWSVRTAVTTAYESAASAADRVPLAAETATVAEALAEAERARLELGTSTPSDLVEAQQSAREAELRRLRALVDAVVAARELEHTTGTLLDRFSLRAAAQLMTEERDAG